jgi:hypothetical protein
MPIDSEFAINPYDISELLFLQQQCTATNVVEGENSSTCSDNNNAKYYVGPISIIQQQQQQQALDDILSSSSSSIPSKGRCMVASRTIEAGELLFVTSSIVQANVQHVWSEWNNKHQQQPQQFDYDDSTTDRTVAELAEHVLLMKCKEAMKAKNYGIINCLLTLERSSSSSTGTMKGTNTSSSNPRTTGTSISRLLGQDHECDHDTNDDNIVNLSDDDIIQIIRRNSFGSDYPTINRIEQQWVDAISNSISTSNSNNSDSPLIIDNMILPSRLLGIYGLASMINHSCIPNAVRVFVNDTMIVHACQPIKENEEIVWSYIPVIHPYHERQLQLQQTHNFTCHCNRCHTESMLHSSLSSPTYKQLLQLQHRTDNSDAQSVHIINQLENVILRNTKLSNELKRYIRISFMEHYMNYINSTVILQQSTMNDNDEKKEHCIGTQFDVATTAEKLLPLAFQLHLSFVACHPVSTEHLSVSSCCIFQNFIC